jgi:SAM-dependent methyltransferase
LLICLDCGSAKNSVSGACPRCGALTSTVRGFPAFAPEIAAGGGGFDVSRYTYLSTIQREHFWFRSRSRLISWSISRFFPTMGSLLEIGCGSGAVLQHLRSACPWISRLAGSEVHVNGLEIARRLVGTGVDLYQMDARHIPFREEFDVVGCFDVLEHVREDEEVISSIRLALKPAGGLLLTVPQHRWLWSLHDEIARHERRYEARRLLDVLSRSRFEVLHHTSFVTLLLPVMLLSRLRERRGDAKESEGMRVGATANRLLGAAMSLERAAIAAGARLPIGGSLLVVARAI